MGMETEAGAHYWESALGTLETKKSQTWFSWESEDLGGSVVWFHSSSKAWGPGELTVDFQAETQQTPTCRRSDSSSWVWRQKGTYLYWRQKKTSALAFDSDLQLLAGAFCFTQATNSNITLIRKSLTEMPRIMFDQMFEHVIAQSN